MITLCWKELRENLRWALLIMAGLGLAEWYALTQTDLSYQVGYYYDGKGLTLCKNAFLTVTAFGCPLAGLLLGLLQILPELRRRDQWASLLHRPVSRGVIFRGKVLAGLLLYALAAGPPFLFSVWLAAKPGQFGVPFVPAMTLAGWADICAGLTYYLAAVATTLPRGVWPGWRALPLLAALHVSYFVTATELFRVAVEAAVLMSLALFTAGWGLMWHQEKLSARPWLARGALLAVLLYGARGLGDFSRSLYEVIGPAPATHDSEYTLADNGLPLRVSYQNSVVTSVTGLDGKPPADKRYQADQIRAHTRYLNTFSAYIGDSHGWHRQTYDRTYRDTYHYLTLTRPYQYPRSEQWFYLRSQRSWLCFALSQKLPDGRLDRKGFEPISVQPAEFPRGVNFSELGDKLILFGHTSVRLASLPKREITDLPLPSAGRIYGVGMAWANTEAGNVSVFGVTLPDQLAVYDTKGALLAKLPYHQDVSRWGQLSVGLGNTTDRFYVRYDPSAWIDGPTRRRLPSYLDEMDAGGQVLHTYTLPPLPPYFRARVWSDFLADRLQSPALFLGELSYEKIRGLAGSRRLAAKFARRLGPDRAWTREISFYLIAGSLMLAAVTLAWARHVYFSWGRAWAWAVFVFAFNLAGFITFRLAADWPQFVPCAACRKSRPVDGLSCPHCGAGWPVAAAEGTEIFDQHAPAALAPAAMERSAR